MTRISLLLTALSLGLLLVAAPAHADILELKDGRMVEGIVVEVDGTYHVQSRFGPSVIQADRVKTRIAARPVDDQVREHLASLASDDAENRALLARWLVELGRVEEGRAMAARVLEMAPESSVAHRVLGHIRHQGVWRTPDEAKRADGLEKHGDTWYTPQEWSNVGGAAREKALEHERKAEAARLHAEVNRAVRLMLSPNDALRVRGRKRLEAMAAEYENASLAELVKNVDAYVRKLDEIAAKALAFSGGGASGTGYVTGAFRATVSKLKRPIETFQTSLASNIGGAPVKIQLPELEVVRVRTMGSIPVVVR